MPEDPGRITGGLVVVLDERVRPGDTIRVMSLPGELVIPVRVVAGTFKAVEALAGLGRAMAGLSRALETALDSLPGSPPGDTGENPAGPS